MIECKTYRGVEFGVYAVSSGNNGVTIVRPIAIYDPMLSALTSGMDIGKCVGKCSKVASDENSDAFGIRQACYRSYRMLAGFAKTRLAQVRASLDEMQKQSRADQDRNQNRRYPKTEKKLTTGNKIGEVRQNGRKIADVVESKK
jgi:hypothetical protein